MVKPDGANLLNRKYFYGRKFKSSWNTLKIRWGCSPMNSLIISVGYNNAMHHSILANCTACYVYIDSTYIPACACILAQHSYVCI